MDTFFATLLIIAAIMAAMSIGVAVSGRRLRGSCGGTDKDCECDEQARQACALKGQRG